LDFRFLIRKLIIFGGNRQKLCCLIFHLLLHYFSSQSLRPFGVSFGADAASCSCPSGADARRRKLLLGCSDSAQTSRRPPRILIGDIREPVARPLTIVVRYVGVGLFSLFDFLLLVRLPRAPRRGCEI
jgi:hypothetical protein